MNNKWIYISPTPEQEMAAERLAGAINVNPVICRMLIERGITTPEEARHFFRPQLNELIDPFKMKDMQKAVDRLNEAMGRKERILVYGDSIPTLIIIFLTDMKKVMEFLVKA